MYLRKIDINVETSSDVGEIPQVAQGRRSESF